MAKFLLIILSLLSFSCVALPPVVTVSPSNSSICVSPGSYVSLTASGASTYVWSPSTGLSSTTGSVVRASPTVQTVYYVVGTALNGSTGSAVAVVAPMLTVTVTPASPVVLTAGQSVVLTAHCSWAGQSFLMTYGPWTPSTGLSTTTGQQVTATPTVTRTYSVTGTGTNGCSNTASVTVTVGPPTVMNVKLFIQGYYLGIGEMENVLYHEAVETNPLSTDVDTVTIELHSPTSPYALVESHKAILQTNGDLTCSFSYAVAGSSYYIAVRHRSAVQTWSAAPVAIATTTNYDFTTAANKAYGNNMLEMEGGNWAFYTGDINQDSNVDLADFSPLSLGIAEGYYGYYASDLNGDGNVDLMDSPYLFSNITTGIFSRQP